MLKKHHCQIADKKRKSERIERVLWLPKEQTPRAALPRQRSCALLLMRAGDIITHHS